MRQYKIRESRELEKIICNKCGKERIIPHVWVNSNDKKCADCGGDLYGDCSNHTEEDNDGHCDHCEIPKQK